jgi:hypothetical protein
MPDFYEEINNWTAGVISSVHGDQGPIEALTYALNTYVSRIGGDQGAIATRPALRVVASFLPTSRAVPAGMAHLQPYSYSPTEDTTYTQYLVALAGDGSVWFKTQADQWDNGVYTRPVTGNQALQSANTQHIDSTVMNNRMFVTALNGEKVSFRGTNFEPFGIAQPTITATGQTKSFANATTQLPADTYDVYATFYNPRTGAEGNPSAPMTVTTTAGQSIEVGISYNSEQAALYGQWKIYARRQSTQAVAYLVNVVDTNGNPFSGPLDLSATKYWINLSTAEWADLITAMPGELENSEPPDEMIYVATYGRRLMGASKRKIYWSKLDQPDNFPPLNFEGIDTGEGDEIMGIYPLRDELLVIFTKGGTWALEGNDPQYWTLKPIDTTIGCVGHKSVIEFDNSLAWWSPQYGPVVLSGGQIQKIGLELLGQDSWTYGPELDIRIKGGWDPQYQHLVWALPQQDDGSLVSQMYPFSYRTNSWVASKWETIPVGAMTAAFNQRGEQRLFVGDRRCSLGYFDANSVQDMIPSGTTEGTFTAGSDSITTIGGSGFYTNVVSGFSTLDLKDRMVTVMTTDGDLVGREWIQSNTSTTLTLRRAMAVTNGTTYRFAIGSPAVQIMTRWMTGKESFLRKRWDRLFLHMVANDTTIPIRISRQTNFNSTSATIIGTSVATAQVANLDATWDVPVQTTEGMKVQRLAVMTNGQALRIIITQLRPIPFVLLKLGLLGRTLSDRYYG